MMVTLSRLGRILALETYLGRHVLVVRKKVSSEIGTKMNII